LNAELLNDVLSGNLRAALAVTDRNSMAHSIEARVPYVDQRIIEFAFQLPDCYKIGNGKRKRVLRLLAERYLPKSVVARVDRIGFGAPIEDWLRTYFRPELMNLLSANVFSRSTLVNPCFLRSFIEEFLAGRHRDVGTVWRIYAIDVWARLHGINSI
jgi:asparagine synthase (glutamine-hydrolysing)